MEISTWIRLSKSTKYRWVLHVDFSMSFRRQIEVTSVLAVSIVSLSNIFCSGNLFEAVLVLSPCNFNNIGVITDTGTSGTISCGNICNNANKYE